MAPIKVGINGFGRIGRIVFRNAVEHPDLLSSSISPQSFLLVQGKDHHSRYHVSSC
jgi:glyceraldehyde-3-phosphate dehydrogenase/erythrose-4-phosphate dehydrogenase